MLSEIVREDKYVISLTYEFPKAELIEKSIDRMVVTRSWNWKK